MRFDLGSYDAVLLDMDGTLVDTESLWIEAVLGIAAELGAEPLDQARLIGGTVASIVAVVGAATGGRHAPADLDLWIDQAVKRRVAEVGVRLRPGARRLLDDLVATGMPCALVTSSGRADTEIILDVLGRAAFAHTVTADDVPRHKPDPLPYATAAALLGVDPSRCVAVEDSLAGLASAEGAGCTTVAVPHLQDIPDAPRRYVLTSLEMISVTAVKVTP
ncbi:HAD family hydrolase [Catellatospora citrea]|uniref:Hydrolase n=1 Tax=Catellatospora citrea TaxID=53366 RepID=A0A8J3P1V4_9ACTN|nr:HAD family hydrolase [Catellatospora citrea]RKE11962.1 HAD superfamily hydrolase (TIGR01509 family) [Catellatospora citrea]GIG00393.1 hydrolase [Catellatospora citrea]